MTDGIKRQVRQTTLYICYTLLHQTEISTSQISHICSAMFLSFLFSADSSRFLSYLVIYGNFSSRSESSIQKNPFQKNLFTNTNYRSQTQDRNANYTSHMQYISDDRHIYIILCNIYLTFICVSHILKARRQKSSRQKMLHPSAGREILNCI